VILVGEQSAEVIGEEVAVARESKYPRDISLYRNNPALRVTTNTPYVSCSRTLSRF